MQSTKKYSLNIQRTIIENAKIFVCGRNNKNILTSFSSKENKSNLNIRETFSTVLFSILTCVFGYRFYIQFIKSIYVEKFNVNIKCIVLIQYWHGNKFNQFAYCRFWSFKLIINDWNSQVCELFVVPSSKYHQSVSRKKTKTIDNKDELQSNT